MGMGDSVSIVVTLPAGASAHADLGIDIYEGITYSGAGSYDNWTVSAAWTDLPDPNGVMSYLTFDADDIDMYLLKYGSLVALSEDSCVNATRAGRVEVVFDIGVGGGWSAETLQVGKAELIAPMFNAYDFTGTVSGPNGVLCSVANTGGEPSVDPVPENNYLYPWNPDGGTSTNKFINTGRHAFADIPLSGGPADDYYHFEAFGFQNWRASYLSDIGYLPGALGNSAYIEFEAHLGADDITIQHDPGGPGTNDTITCPPGGSTVWPTIGGGEFMVIMDGTNAGTVITINANLGAGVLDTLDELVDDLVGPVKVAIVTLITDTWTSWPHLDDAVLVGAEVAMKCHYRILDAAAATGLDTLDDFDTNIQAQTTWANYLDPGASSSTGASYLNSGATGTNTISDVHDSQIYNLSFGADPYNYGGAMTNTYTLGGTNTAYPRVLGQAMMTAQQVLNLQDKQFGVRLNGGAETIVTIDPTATLPADITASINAQVGVNIASTWAPVSATVGVEYCSGTAAVSAGANTTLTDLTKDFVAMDVTAGGEFRCWVYDTVGGTNWNALSAIGAVGGATNIDITANITDCTSCSYTIVALPAAGAAIPCIRFDLNDALLATTTAGSDCSIELREIDGLQLLMVGSYSSSDLDYEGCYFGDPITTAVGDTLYNGGVEQGVVTAFENYAFPAGVLGTGTLTNAITKLDAQAGTMGTPIAYWYYQAENLTSTSTGLIASRPLPELTLSSTLERFTIKSGIGRDNGGMWVSDPSFSMVCGYDALRSDLSALGSGVTILGGTDDITTTLGTISSRNPLTVGAYLAMNNAPNTQVKVLSVDAVSTAQPQGTTSAYNNAFGLLEANDVYSIAPLTADRSVHDALKTHIETMEDPETGRSERLGFVCQTQPTERKPTSVGTDTGVDAVVNLPTFTFDLAIDPATGFNIAAALIGKTDALGNPVPTFGICAISDGLYIERSGDGFRYSVSEIAAGNVLKCRTTGFSAGSGPATNGNDDAFFSEDLPGYGDSPTWDVDGETVTLFVRQASVSYTTTTGRQYAAEAISDMASRYGTRRMAFVQPDQVTYNDSGTDVVLHGYYACAALAGKASALPPHQSFTGTVLYGIEACSGSWDQFSEANMDLAAGGGVMWLIQESADGPVFVRHQLTTDVSSLQTRELSITRVLDYMTKIIRTNINRLAGRYNITPNFMALLSTIINTLVSSFSGVIVQRATVVNIVIDPDNPDTILIEVDITPYYPANRIRVTLVV